MSITETRRFTRTDLARKTREILDEVRRGRPAVIESYGEEQAVVIDPLDYRLLQAMASLERRGGEGRLAQLRDLLRRYLSEEISLGRLAADLGLSRFELLERFEHLGITTGNGPATADEARREVEMARELG